MSQPRLAALFLAVLAAGTAVLVTMVTLLVQFHGGSGKSDVWRSLVVALSGVGIALSVIGLVHLSFIAARRAAGARRTNLVAGWLDVWSAVAAGARDPAVERSQQVVASEAAAAILQELTGQGAQRVRAALSSSGVIASEINRAAGVASQDRGSVEALERLAWIAAPESLKLFERAVSGGARASRAALLGAMRVLAEESRTDQVGSVVVEMVERYLRTAKDPAGARPFLSAALLSAGDNLGWLCTSMLEDGSHEQARIAALDAISRSHRSEAGECAGDVLLRGAQGETKAAALRGLARVGHVPLFAVAAVITATEDDSSAVRVNATHALAGVDPGLGLPALWRCLADRSWDVRLAASDTLTRYGSVGLDLLKRAASEHTDRFARDIASMTIGEPLPRALGIVADDFLDMAPAAPQPAGSRSRLAPDMGA